MSDKKSGEVEEKRKELRDSAATHNPNILPSTASNLAFVIT
jgi:hypothetical protein